MNISSVIAFSTLRQRQNGRHFPDNICKCIFFNENVWISVKISLKFVPKGPINNIPALVQIMAWRMPGHKPLSAPMMVSSLTHICVTWPHCVRWTAKSAFDDKSKLIQVMAWCHQATSHYLNQCWLRSIHGAIRHHSATLIQHIKACAKWLPFWRQHFQWSNYNFFIDLYLHRETRQIRTPVLRIPPAVTSQAKMKNWLHECQKWVSHMIGQYAHI